MIGMAKWYGHITTEGDVMLKAVGKIAVVAMALCCGSAGVNAQTRSDNSRVVIRHVTAVLLGAIRLQK